MSKKKTTKSKSKYKAVNPKEFAETHNDIVPCYKELSEGESVALDLKNKDVENWIHNKIIIKE